ncbi:MAG: hypothetical protein A2959_01155 [Candidatus Levybacteria bacterium RIFCSPLOWO2_01_FULL_38_23]|nr:MAG: hypothetical protein A2959_01155 [Candidatus Levybacteria bacterium RIFCSPLOWO2_01_FULL_38_23]
MLTPIERIRRYELKDSGEAKPGQRQRGIVLARFEINEAETNWKYPSLQDLVPIVYEDRYYPEGETYLIWQAGQSLDTFVRSLALGRRHAIKIADEVREEIGCEDLTDGEIIDVLNRDLDFRNYAIRIGLHSEND